MEGLEDIEILQFRFVLNEMSLPCIKRKRTDAFYLKVKLFLLVVNEVSALAQLLSNVITGGFNQVFFVQNIVIS